LRRRDRARERKLALKTVRREKGRRYVRRLTWKDDRTEAREYKRTEQTSFRRRVQGEHSHYRAQGADRQMTLIGEEGLRTAKRNPNNKEIKTGTSLRKEGSIVGKEGEAKRKTLNVSENCLKVLMGRWGLPIKKSFQEGRSTTFTQSREKPESREKDNGRNTSCK